MSAADLINILLVEDNEADVELAQEALELAKVANRLHVVYSGEEALQFLRREPPHADAPRPDLIFLDLNLPGINGREVLAEVKEDPQLKIIPVLVLTTSQADEDIHRAYELHANAYVRKPIKLETLVDVVQTIEGFWLGVVQLPTRPA